MCATNSSGRALGLAGDRLDRRRDRRRPYPRYLVEQVIGELARVLVSLLPGHGMTSLNWPSDHRQAMPPEL